MAAPVIVTTTSVLAYRLGEFFVFQPAASNTPTSWAAAGLPTGMSINGTTGKISGAATEPGVYNISITATNGDGTSAPLVVAMGIESVDFGEDASIELDFDLLTGKVTNPGQAESEEDPYVLYAKKGDTLLLSVGFTKGGYLQDLPVAQVNLGLKEFEPEGLLLLNDGLFIARGSYDTKRYVIAVYFDPEVLTPVLSNYEDDKSTHLDARAEIRVGMLHVMPGDEDPSVLERSSVTFALRIARDIAPDIEE